MLAGGFVIIGAPGEPKKLWSIHTVDYHSAVEKQEIVSFAVTRVDLEVVILSELRQRQMSRGMTDLRNFKKGY